MKLNVTKPLLAINQEPLKLGPEKVATLKWAITEAMCAVFQGENINGAEKFSRYKLAMKVQCADSEVDLSIEEVAKAKDLIGKHFPPTVVGPAYEQLEGAS